MTEEMCFKNGIIEIVDTSETFEKFIPCTDMKFIITINGEESLKSTVKNMLDVYIHLQNQMEYDCLLQISSYEEEKQVLTIYFENEIILPADTYINETDFCQLEMLSHMFDLLEIRNFIAENLEDYPLYVSLENYSIALRSVWSTPYMRFCITPISFIALILDDGGNGATDFDGVILDYVTLSQKNNEIRNKIESFIMSYKKKGFTEAIKTSLLWKDVLSLWDLPSIQLKNIVVESIVKKSDQSFKMDCVVDNENKCLLEQHLDSFYATKEAFISQYCKHPNIVEFYGFKISKVDCVQHFVKEGITPDTEWEGPFAYTLVEYLYDGSLKDYVDELHSSLVKIDKTIYIFLFGQILNVCWYLYKEFSLTYNDLKVSSIMLCEKEPMPYLKLTCLGKCNSSNITMIDEDYVPPVSEELSSIGCCFYYIIFGKDYDKEDSSLSQFIHPDTSEGMKLIISTVKSLLGHDVPIGWDAIVAQPHIKEWMNEADRIVKTYVELEDLDKEN